MADEVLKHAGVDSLPEVMLQPFKDNVNEVKKMKAECSKALASAKKAAEKGTELEPLSFDAKDGKSAIDSMATEAKKLKKMLQLMEK